MKLLGASLALSFVFAIMTNDANVSAAPEPVMQQLHISARVLPSQSVIIDNAGAIIEVVSNTTEDVRPKVYVNSIAKENEVPLSEAVYASYRSLVPEGASRVGVLYRKSILEPSLRPDNDLSALLDIKVQSNSGLALFN